MNKILKTLFVTFALTMSFYAVAEDKQNVEAIKAECAAEAKEYNAIDPQEYVESCVKERVEDEAPAKSE